MFMRKQNPVIYMLIIISVFVSFAQGAQQDMDEALLITAFSPNWSKKLRHDQGDNSERSIAIDVFLTNSGKHPIRILTAGWTRAGISERDERGDSFTEVINFRHVSRFGIESVPSPHVFAPVEIPPNECYILTLTVRVPRLVLSPRQLRLRYSVDKALGSAFGAWYGQRDVDVSDREPR